MWKVNCIKLGSDIMHLAYNFFYGEYGIDKWRTGTWACREWSRADVYRIGIYNSQWDPFNCEASIEEGTHHNYQKALITANDLTVEVPNGVPTDQNGLPLNAGQYVVKVKQSVIDNFNVQHPDYKLSNDPNTNAWYVVKHRQVSFTINGTPSSTYNGQAVSLKDGNYSIIFSGLSLTWNQGGLCC